MDKKDASKENRYFLKGLETHFEKGDDGFCKG
jgi:hypothetical protein